MTLKAGVKQRIGRPARVHLLSAGLLAATAIFWNLGVAELTPPVAGVTLPVWALALGFAATEVFVVHLQLRQHAQSFSLSEIPTVLGLFFVDPLGLLAARLIGSGLALLVWRRQSLTKLAFNLSYFSLDTMVLLAVFHAVLGSGDAQGPAGWLAAAVACLVAMVVGTVAIATAIALVEGRYPAATTSGMATLGIPVALANVTLGLLAVTVLPVDGRAALLFAAVALTFYAFYRNHTRLRGDHAGLAMLYDITRTVSDGLEKGGTVELLLAHATDLVQAEQAELVVRTGTGATRTIYRADTRELTTEPAPNAERLQELVASSGSVLLAGRQHRAVLDELGHRNAIVSQLRSGQRELAVMVVADRVGELLTFSEHDQRMLQTLANHAAVALRNSSLLERLRFEIAEREHQALHDGLTELPNRIMFKQRTEAALRSMTSNEMAAVMIIDLDRFKEVNDTLGHHHGDQLLVEIGQRIRSTVGDRGVVARLGGDEFAVLVPACVEGQAREVAENIHHALEAPFAVGEIPIAVGASVGIALAPEDGDDTQALMRHADVAMYLAKSTKSGVQRYSPSADHYTTERLAMVAKLKNTIDDNEVLVEYQPIIDVESGDLVAVECLARWHHPDHGWVTPDVFIPIAEHTGLIRPLTGRVLDTAARQCRAWRDEGIPMRISVNVSARSLLDPDFPDQVEQALHAAALPPGMLTVEVTETSIMADAARTIASLNRLAGLGVSLSVDDYGTGYSSLSYLKNLPVDELKIDRAFVAGMATDRRDRVIVENTIELAHQLQLQVVAEGVEDAATMSQLRVLGCDRAQGFHLARPKTPGQLRTWLAERTNQSAPANPAALGGLDLAETLRDPAA